MDEGFVPYPPDDFDEFWLETTEAALRAPLDFHRSLRNEFDAPGFVVESFRFRAIDGASLNGWIAAPIGARRLPAFVWVPPYGRESVLPNQYGTRPGFVSLSLNFHGETAFHQEKYVNTRGYFANGAEDPATWIFRRMYQNAVLATRILQAQLEVDEDRIGAMGLSQGAGMSIWLGAWCPIVKAICSDMPFLAGINRTIVDNVYRYPLRELKDFIQSIPVGEQRVLNTLSYYDTINHATRCRKPTQISLGLRDPACRPPNVRAVYQSLAGEKRLVEYDWGHDYHPDMVANNLAWLQRNLL